MEVGLSLVSLCVLQSWGVEHPGALGLAHLPSCFAGLSLCPTKISQTPAAASLSLLLRSEGFQSGPGKEKVVLEWPYML